MATKYTASDLRHTVEFVRLDTSSTDSGGGRIRQWVSLIPPIIVPAMIQPRSSRERFIAGQTASSETVLIVIRWRGDLSQSMRVKYGTRLYHILGMINVEERSRWIEIDAEEKFGE